MVCLIAFLPLIVHDLQRNFWATVCKMVRPVLSDHYLSCPVLSVCGVGVLWPNGWMDQDATLLDGDPAPPPPKGRGAPPLNFFDPCLLWPNGWMDEDATWCGSRPRPGHVVLDGDPVPQ